MTSICIGLGIGVSRRAKGNIKVKIHGITILEISIIKAGQCCISLGWVGKAGYNVVLRRQCSKFLLSHEFMK